MKIAVFGAHGRVGTSVCRIAKNKHEIVEIEKYTDTDGVCADVAIDFSTAEATENVCNFCKQRNIPLVTGVTGRDSQQQTLVEELKKHVPVAESANFSAGFGLLKEACKILAKAGWDCEIVETHRKQKRDRPSGTAKLLAKTILQQGQRSVRIHSLRCGSNFGRHEIVFATKGESITLTHQAENVDIFARGAILQAENLVKTNCAKQKNAAEL